MNFGILAQLLMYISRQKFKKKYKKMLKCKIIKKEAEEMHNLILSNDGIQKENLV